MINRKDAENFSFYSWKTKKFAPKKWCSTFFYEQNFSVCQDRKLKYSGFMINLVIISWNLKISVFYLDKQKSFVPANNRDFMMQIFWFPED